MSSILNKPFREMTIPELVINYYYWRTQVENATGWSSAYFAAKCLKASVDWLNHHFCFTINPYPIKRG